MTSQSFKALLVSEVTEKEFSSGVVERNVSDLPEGEVLIRVEYSSLNYKAVSYTHLPLPTIYSV